MAYAMRLLLSIQEIFFLFDETENGMRILRYHALKDFELWNTSENRKVAMSFTHFDVVDI